MKVINMHEWAEIDEYAWNRSICMKWAVIDEYAWTEQKSLNMQELINIHESN